MKKITKHFIWANIFDAISTGFALSQGCVEMNILVNRYGWIVGCVAKILATILVAYVLERVKEWWFFWVLPILIWLIVVWNIFNGIMVATQ